jgi:hypothetical protein
MELLKIKSISGTLTSKELQWPEGYNCITYFISIIIEDIEIKKGENCKLCSTDIKQKN